MDEIKLKTENDPLSLSEAQKNRFAEAALDSTFDHTNMLVVRNKALEDLRSDFDDLCLLNKQPTVFQRLKHFRVLKAAPEDFCERVFEIKSLGLVLAGIRWVGGNPSKPFVSVWPDFPVASYHELRQLVQIAEHRFAVFAPGAVSLWLRPDSPLAADLGQKNPPNRRYIVGRIERIKLQNQPDHYDAVDLIKPDRDEYFDWYVDLYKEFHAVRPDLKDWVTVSDKRHLEDCRKAGLLFFVRVDGYQAGLIAGHPWPLLGQAGLYFSELMLKADFRGKGLAPAIQRKFIDNLSEGYEVVWGTIDAQNITSTKTALRVGRHSIREEFFIKIGA